jgi:hypothetical protein
LKAKGENDPCRFTREEAQRVLNEVRERYGLRRAESPANPGVNAAFSAPKEPASQQPRPLVSEPSGPNRPFLPSNGYAPDRIGNSEGFATQEFPPNGSPSDNQKYHYLIRVAECALTLHCEVTADSEPAARHRVKQIRNLLVWREISAEELAEIIKNEKSHSAA